MDLIKSLLLLNLLGAATLALKEDLKAQKNHEYMKPFLGRYFTDEFFDDVYDRVKSAEKVKRRSHLWEKSDLETEHIGSERKDDSIPTSTISSSPPSKDLFKQIQETSPTKNPKGSHGELVSEKPKDAVFFEKLGEEAKEDSENSLVTNGENSTQNVTLIRCTDLYKKNGNPSTDFSSPVKALHSIDPSEVASESRTKKKRKTTPRGLEKRQHRFRSVGQDSLGRRLRLSFEEQTTKETEAEKDTSSVTDNRRSTPIVRKTGKLRWVPDYVIENDSESEVDSDNEEAEGSPSRRLPETEETTEKPRASLIENGRERKKWFTPPRVRCPEQVRSTLSNIGDRCQYALDSVPWHQLNIMRPFYAAFQMPPPQQRRRFDRVYPAP